MTDPLKPEHEREALKGLIHELKSWRSEVHDQLARTERPPEDSTAHAALDSFVRRGGTNPTTAAEQNFAQLAADFAAGIADVANRIANQSAVIGAHAEAAWDADWARDRIDVWEEAARRGLDVSSVCRERLSAFEPSRRATGALGMAELAFPESVTEDDILAIFHLLGDDHSEVRRSGFLALEGLRERLHSTSAELRAELRHAVGTENPLARPFCFAGIGGGPNELARFCNEVAWKLQVREVTVEEARNLGSALSGGHLLLVRGVEQLGDEASGLLVEAQRMVGCCVVGLATFGSRRGLDAWDVAPAMVVPVRVPPLRTRRADVALTFAWCAQRVLASEERALFPRFTCVARSLLLERGSQDEAWMRERLDELFLSSAGVIDRQHVEGVLPTRARARPVSDAVAAMRPPQRLAAVEHRALYDSDQLGTVILSDLAVG